MKHSKRVTVGIPVYNVEKYIARCLESVINQDYVNIDILIMYDKSSDQSLEIARKVLSSSKIKHDVLLNKLEKSSIGIARNLMLKNFEGDYLIFLDSDDFLEPGCISHLVSLSQKYDADIVKSSHRSLDENNVVLKEELYPKEEVFDNHEFKNKLYIKNYHHSFYSWNKLYKRSFLKDNEMQYKHDVVEDAFFTFNEVENAKKIVLTPNITYNYLVRPNSLTNIEATFGKISVFVDNKKFIDDFYKNNKNLYAYCCKIDIFIMTYIMVVRDAFASSLISKENKLKLLHQAFETPKLPFKIFFAATFYKNWKVALIVLVKCLPFSANLKMVNLYHKFKGNKV
jgi:glycosyltransferase involved in cell wall biosynthesis